MAQKRNENLSKRIQNKNKKHREVRFSTDRRQFFVKAPNNQMKSTNGATYKSSYPSPSQTKQKKFTQITAINPETTNHIKTISKLTKLNAHNQKFKIGITFSTSLHSDHDNEPKKHKPTRTWSNWKHANSTTRNLQIQKTRNATSIITYSTSLPTRKIEMRWM